MLYLTILQNLSNLQNFVAKISVKLSWYLQLNILCRKISLILAKSNVRRIPQHGRVLDTYRVEQRSHSHETVPLHTPLSKRNMVNSPQNVNPGFYAHQIAKLVYSMYAHVQTCVLQVPVAPSAFCGQRGKLQFHTGIIEGAVVRRWEQAPPATHSQHMTSQRPYFQTFPWSAITPKRESK